MRMHRKHTNRRSRLWWLVLGCVVVGALGNVALWMYVRSSAPTVAPVAETQPALGISTGDTLPFLAPAELAKRLDDMASLHVQWIRMDFAWSEVQPTSSRAYDWANIDRVVAAATTRHIQVLPVLAYSPAWARGANCTTEKCAPADPAAFAAFAVQAAARYAPQGVNAWEIWNEPNAKDFWQPYPSASDYASLLHVTHAALRSVDPTATIIIGGLAPGQAAIGAIAPTEFLSQLYEADAKDSFEAVGFHPYSYPQLPSQYADSSAWSQMASTTPSLRSIMVAHEDGDKKIWLTEFGAPTGGPDGVTEIAQATMLADAVSLARGYAWAGPFMWYSYQDLGISPSTSENFFGIRRHDGTLKPVYTTLKSLLARPAL